MLTVDTILQERYRIVRQLGQGGMGAVYQAVDERIDKTVAIKEILLELENTSDKKQQNLIKQAFRREANSLVKARHEAVPDVTDYFSEFEREFLVMEFIEGDDLMKMLQKRKKPFSIEEVFPWIDQLLVALNYLHNLKPPIIHRDIKPQNLKVNEWQKVKLLDFGVAKNTDKAATITQMTFIGATLSYSPIEQILRVIDPMFRELILLKHKDNAENILGQNTDSRCDIFALGATFYHLLTNYPPVDVTKRALEFWEGKGDPLPNPSSINPELSNAISAWLIKSMAIERNDRFANAVEMRKALHDAIAQKDQQTASQTVTQENERVSQEQVLMQAKTERLIELPELKKSQKEPVQNTLPSTANQPTNAFSLHDDASTDYNFADTGVSNYETSGEITEVLNIDDDFIRKQNESSDRFKESGFMPPSQVGSGSSASKGFNYVLLLPIVGVLAFVVFGGGILGAIMLMSQSDEPIEGKTVIENKNANVSKTPEATTSIETDLKTPEASSTKETESTPVSADLPSAPVKETQTTAKPIVQSTPKPVAKPTANPVTAPKPSVEKTTVPAATKKPKPAKDPNCIYTNSC